MKKTLLFVIPTLVGGGAEKNLANLSMYLYDYYNIHILVFSDTKIKYTFKGTLHFFNRKPTKNILKRIYNYIDFLAKIRKLKKEINVDCSISYLPNADVVNVLSSIGEKKIISIRNNLSSAEYMKGLLKVFHHYAVKKVDFIVSITKGVEQDTIVNYKISKDKIKTIYNPSITIDFSSENNFDTNDYKNYIISVGRLTHQKGQWHLIRAFKIIHNKFPNLKLIIIGTGPLKDYLNELIKEMKLEDCILLKGFVTNPYDYIRNAELFVFPSLYEGLGNSLLEAMKLSVPIISSDCDYGPREILDPKSNFMKRTINDIEYNAECGVLIPVCDGKHYGAYDELTNEELLIAEAVIGTLKNTELKKRLIQNSKGRISDFSLNSIGEEWIKIIEGVLS